MFAYELHSHCCVRIRIMNRNVTLRIHPEVSEEFLETLRIHPEVSEEFLEKSDPHIGGKRLLVISYAILPWI